jgi:hypothetical protein
LETPFHEMFLESKKILFSHPFLHDCPVPECSFAVD